MRIAVPVMWLHLGVGAMIVMAPALAGAVPDDGAHIIGGAATTDPAVVGLAGPRGNVYCTGTVISPRVILTAAHCVLPDPPRLAYFGARPTDDGVFVPITDIVVHPDASLTTLLHDVAVVRLGRASPVTPARLPAVPLDDTSVGQRLRLVGFGLSDPSDDLSNGDKLTGTTNLAGIDPLWLHFGAVACFGDSGGPAFLDDGHGEVLIGITSHGDPACAGGGTSARVDVERAWIDSQVARLDQAACDLDTRCVASCPTDPDCLDTTISDPAPSSAGCTVSDGRCGRGAALLAGLVALGLGLRRRRRRAGGASGSRAWYGPVSALLGTSVALSGCTTNDDELAASRRLCRTRPIGDPGAVAEVELVLQEQGVLRPIGSRVMAGGALALSVRVRNVDGCAVAVRLVDGDGSPLGGTFIELQLRDGWGWPSISAFNTVTVPARSARRDVWAIVEDQHGHSGVSRSLTIIP